MGLAVKLNLTEEFHMAVTTMSSANNSTIKKWQKKTWLESYQQSAFGLLSESGSVYDASVDFRNDNGRGDSITFNYVSKLVDNPIGEGGTGFGNEEALNTGTDSMSVNLTRILVSNPNNNTIEQQRTNIQFDEVSAMHQARRAVELMDASCFQQLAGVNPTAFTINGTTYNTPAKKLQVQGHNVPSAPSANRIIRAGGAATDEALTSSDTFSMDLLDFTLERIMGNDQPIDPCSDGYFKLFLHPFQSTALKHDSSGKIQWYTNNLAMEQGGKESNLTYQYGTKPIALGEYAGVKIYQAPRVANGASSADDSVITTVRRAVLVGRDALTFASPFGGISQNDTDVPFKMYVQFSDYDYIKGQDLRSIYGVKKLSPDNAEDVGAFVISTYAAASS